MSANLKALLRSATAEDVLGLVSAIQHRKGSALANYSYAQSWAPSPFRRGLDVACGDCPRTSKQMVGIDLHRGEWWPMKDKMKRTSPNVQADIRRIPFRDNTFGLVTAIHVLEHFRHPFLVVPEWIRVLRPGGRLVIIIPAIRSVPRQPRHKPRCVWGHYREFNIFNLVADMREFHELELLDARVMGPARDAVAIALEKRE